MDCKMKMRWKRGPWFEVLCFCVLSFSLLVTPVLTLKTSKTVTVDQVVDKFLRIASNQSNQTLLHEMISYVVSIKQTKSFALADETGTTILHAAVRHMEVQNETLELFKEYLADFNAITNENTSVLNAAIEGGRSESLLKTLVQLGAEWNVTNSELETPLHYAAFHGNLPAIKLFSELGSDVNAIDINGTSILINAAAGGQNESFLNTLIELGADWRINDMDNDTVLHYAAYNGNLPAFKLFSELGSDVNALNKNQTSVLNYAVVGRQNESFLNTLIQLGADWRINDQENDTVLHFAAYNVNLEAMTMFINLGADVNAINNDGDTPLHTLFFTTPSTTNSSVVELVTELISHGADPFIQNKIGNLPLDYARSVLEDPDVKNSVMELLVNACRHPNDFKTENMLEELSSMNSTAMIARTFQVVAYQDLNTIKSVLEFVQNTIEPHEIFDEEQKSLLHIAVSAQDIDVVEYLLNEKGFLAKLNDSTFNADLIWNCIWDINEITEKRYQEKVKILYLLFKLNPELIESKITEQHRTPLQIATESVFTNGKQLEFIQMMVDHKADVNARDAENSTALILIVYFNPNAPQLMEIIQLLITHNADPTLHDKFGESFLHKAAWKCTPPIFHEIVAYLDSINDPRPFTDKVEDGGTILIYAVSFMEVRNETLEIFKKHAVDFNQTKNNGVSLLNVAIQSGRTSTFLQSLIAFGADWTLQSNTANTRETPLHYAAYFGNMDGIKLFLSMGGDINAVDSEETSVLNSAVTGGQDEHFLSELIALGAKSNVNKNLETPLHFAAYSGNLNAIKYFKDLGCNVNGINLYNNSVLARAIQGGQDETVLNALINLGASWDAMNINNDNALHYAADWGNLHALNLFIELGINVNDVNKLGATPLHQVFWHDRVTKLEVVKELLKYGAKVNIRDTDGDLPIDIARRKQENGTLEDGIIELLENTGNQI